MSDAYLGEIRVFAGSYAPNNWAFCDGQLLPISQYSALFAILGVQYGGNGTSNFALPNLKGSVPIGQGTGLGLSQRTVGETGGSTAVTLTTSTIPAHNHVPMGYASDGSARTPVGNVWAQSTVGGRHGSTRTSLYNTTSDTRMSPLALGPAGGSAAHNNMQPFLGLSFIICLNGIFPTRA